MNSIAPTLIPHSPIVALAVALIFVGVLVSGCDTGSADSLFDPDRAFNPDPVITAIDPPAPSLAGIGTLIFHGENFSSIPSENLVFFDDLRATVVEASPTQLVVQTPNLPRSEINVRVSVLGAESISNVVHYRLEAAVLDFGDVKDFEEPFAVASDGQGNVFVSLFANAASIGIKRVSPDGARSDYVSTTFKWDDLVLAEDGYLYAVRGVQAVFRFLPGGSQENWAVLSAASSRLDALTIDEAGNIWTAGRAGNIYRIDPQATPSGFPFDGDVTALAIFEGHLYIAAVSGQDAAIWRANIQGGDMGSLERYFDVTENAGIGVRALSLAFAASGELFVGTNASDPLILVRPDGTWEHFYPGIIAPPARYLTWGAGTNLIVSRPNSESGRGKMTRVNTLREGAR